MPGVAASDLHEILERTEDVWRSLRGARIFLTGGTGFFGGWLLEAFAHARRRTGYEIPMTVLSRNPNAAVARFGALLEGVDLIQGDTRDFAFPPGNFTHVIHGATAASASLNASNPFEMFDVIVGGTRRALEFAHARNAARFFLVSSGAVYGPQPSDMTHVPEAFGGGPPILNAASAYAEGKRAAELLSVISSQNASFTLSVARGFAFVGPYLPLDAHFAIGNFLRDAMAGGPIRILGDGTPFRSYMYGTDLAVWLWSLLLHGRAGTAYNVGSNDGRPLREIATRVAIAAGVNVEIAKQAPPNHAPERYVPDVALAMTTHGLSLDVSLDEAIRRTIAFHSGKAE